MIEVCELIDMELDAVSGGFFDLSNLSNNIVAQANSATQVGVAQGGSSVFGCRWCRCRHPAARAGEYQLDRLSQQYPAHSLVAPGGVRVLISIENSHGHKHPRAMNCGNRPRHGVDAQRAYSCPPAERSSSTGNDPA
ncbi:hypothetical protein ACVWZ4_004465 [Bradyrhizobium sp. USDA 4472]